MTSPKLSLVAAILINVNIMLGSGVFINTVLLSSCAQALGGFSYVMVALLLLPLIYAISTLMRIEGGSFYDFGALIHPLLGFIMSWSYFTAKLASCALGIHICIILLQVIFPGLAAYNTLILDSAVLFFFMILNLLNLQYGWRIQYGFIILKLIPLLFIIISALFFFNVDFFTFETLKWQGLFETIPFVIFAFAGFEASCSLSQTIENPEKNGPRAILISFAMVVTIITLYQTAFFGLLGPALGTLASFKQAYPKVINLLLGYDQKSALLWQVLTLIGIASSSLGASYGIMYSNAWNLHILAQKNHVFGASFFKQFNKHGIPLWCIIAEAVIAASYLWISQGHQVPLQQVSAIGSTITYTACALVFFWWTIKQHKDIFIGFCSILSCLILFSGIIRNSIIYGILPYIFFITIVFIGITMFLAQNYLTQLKRQ